MSDMKAFAEELIKDRKSELERLKAKHDRLRTALEEVRELADMTAPMARLNALLRIFEIADTALAEGGRDE
jgi:hypothetical protein